MKYELLRGFRASQFKATKVSYCSPDKPRGLRKPLLILSSRKSYFIVFNL
jgi:hypothetical protein